ncbi:MAG: hypothetical protein LBQ70_06050 [Prevotellaceae bacterium]|nr:hypothetical protein [Prevotellaceae bacterium]
MISERWGTATSDRFAVACRDVAHHVSSATLRRQDTRIRDMLRLDMSRH